MTVKEIIEKVDSLRRNNQFTIGDKMKWLNQCEARLQLECLLMPCVEVQYEYTADADEELLAKTPYDELYVYYICAKIDEALSEMEKYNNTISQYNDVHESFQKWLIKTHDPKHNRIHIRREAPVIFRGDEVTVNLYGLPVDAEEVTETKVLLTQNEVTTELADVTMEGDTLTFTLTAAQSYALSKGSLFVGYDILSGEYRYREEQAKRFYVKLAPELQAIVDGEQGSPVDASLTIHGRAADAGVTGAEIQKALRLITELQKTAADLGLDLQKMAVESTEHPGCWYRIVEGETEWLNPPMIVGVEYRTTKRYGGKVVYVKTVNYGTMPNTTFATKSHGITMSGITENRGMQIKPDGSTVAFPLHYATGSEQQTIDLLVNLTSIIITTDFDASDRTANVEIWYTKA